MTNNSPNNPSVDQSADTVAPESVASASLGLHMGDQIGYYKLIEILGEGGFGIVWRAEQIEPVKREVALKIIKPGMDTKNVIARFEAERQALAVMNHPCVAKVFDAGVTPQKLGSRPYFVMELVPGVPITEHCDKQKLSIDDRLDLFMQVCEAVQHAHQKGIIHRDLKPSNILLSVRDGKPLPKVIDFGVAKAVHQKLTDKTLYTEQGQLIGTPEYMSPEQAEMSAQDIDTRSDIYSLGVLLYELLTGALPFDPTSLRKAAVLEIQRIIREVEPQKPSTRLSSLSDVSMTNAINRRIDTRSLTRALRGDLDWIVMKALEKDRNRRYSTATNLIEDIKRHLNNEPVLAGPPSAAYKLKKFVRRNKVGVIAGSVVTTALVVATVISILFAKQANIALDEAQTNLEAANNAIEEAEKRTVELKLVSEFQAAQLSDIDVELMATRLREDLLDEASFNMQRQQLSEDEIASRKEQLVSILAGANFTNISLQVLKRNILKSALQTVDEQFMELPLVRAQLLHTLANTLRKFGLLDQATTIQTEALKIRRRILGNEHPDTLTSINNMGGLLFSHGKLLEAMQYFKEALDSRRHILGDEHPETLISISSMGYLLKRLGKIDEATPYYTEALISKRRILGDEHTDTLTSINDMGQLLKSQGKFEEAMSYYTEALNGRRRVLGNEHPDTLNSINNMGSLLRSQGKLDKAMSYYTEALVSKRRILGDEHPGTLITIKNIGALLRELNRLEEAEKMGAEAVSSGRITFSANHWRLGIFLVHHAETLAKMARFSESEEEVLEAYDILFSALGIDHARTTKVAQQIIDLYTQWHEAEPNNGYDVKAKEWQGKMPSATEEAK